jgi:hypothetical protein
MQQPRTSLARQLCRRVLSTVQTVDNEASITSVSRWDHDNATLVRIRASGSQTPHGILNALKRAWPLACVSLVENVVEGTTEAQMLVPSRDEQQVLARQQALTAISTRITRAILRLVACATLVSFLVVTTSKVVANES